LDPQARIAELEAARAADAALIAKLEAENRELRQTVAQLGEKIAELTARLSQNSRNSNRPPSADPPGVPGGKGRKGKGSKKNRGGQRGHKGRHRELVPEDQVSEIKDHFPKECESCWQPLPAKPDPNPQRFQTTEIPPIKPHVVEHRYHTVKCTCGHTTSARPDQNVLGSPFGPRLMALVAMFIGVYHLSRRSVVTVLADVLGVRISLGAVSSIEARVSEAVEPAVEEAWVKARDAPVKHADGTTWKQGGELLALWTLATKGVTVFKVLANGTKKTLAALFGELKGILVSDRATALNFWAMEQRQICWAHLLRKFVSFSESSGKAGAVGRELLQCVTLVFDYWHGYQDGHLSREKLVEIMAPLQSHIEALLTRASKSGIKQVAGSCKDILNHASALWTFVTTPGVEPTNNHAERELRGFVLWRKSCFGSNSERGNLFAERLMTVAHTARKQNRHVLGFLTECCEASRSKRPGPSLFTTA
jgi:transposase